MDVDEEALPGVFGEPGTKAKKKRKVFSQVSKISFLLASWLVCKSVF
jgi:hypothetical protein